MHSFTYYNPVKIIFGEESLNKLNSIISAYSKNILLVIGKGSIKQSGTLEKILEQLKDSNITILENIESNPGMSKVYEGIELVKEKKCSFILAAGGGSVIDTAKAIAVGSQYNGDVWDFYSGKEKPVKALPIGVILTIAATGSEMNPITVLTNHKLSEKIGIGNPLMYPKFSILDPKLTVSVPLNYSAYSAADIIAHAIEGYFTKDDNSTPIQNGFVFAIVRTVMDAINIILTEPDNLKARTDIMWASTLALNGLLTAGIGKYRFENHMFGHTLSAFFNTPHGATLSIIIPAWLRVNKDRLNDRIMLFGKEVFNKNFNNADDVIYALENFFSSIGSPVRLEEQGINAISDEMIENVRNIALKRNIEFSKQYIRQVYEEAL